MSTTAQSIGRLPDRIETRWILPAASYASVRALLKRHFRTLTYSNRPWVQSVLFNNDSRDLPPEIGIKLRRYTKSPLKGKFCLFKGAWWLETKTTGTEHAHHELKSREAVTLAQAVRRFRRANMLCHLTDRSELCPLNTPLRPYAAIEYHREHFIGKNDVQCRVTLDRDIRFWHQFQEGTWLPLRPEQGIRLELKCYPSLLASPLWRSIRAMLIAECALPVIGKRYAASNRLAAWQRTLIPLPLNELPGVEYGISFDIGEPSSPTLCARLYQLFVRDKHFTIKAERPWISEGGLIRIYFKDQLRLNLYSDIFRWIWIANVPRRPSGALVRHQRQEKSEHRLLIHSQISEYFFAHSFHGALLQDRRQFWVEDREKRVFQVSVFRSFNFSSHDQLTQVDLQYIGRTVPADPHSPEKKVKRQLRALARLVKSHCGELKPAHRSLFAFATMKETDSLNPVAQVLSRIGKGRVSEQAKATP